MRARIGSLFSGYGGLDLAVKEVFPEAETAFVADVCKVSKEGVVGHHEPHRSPCSILAHNFPDAPNLGDVSAIDWEGIASPDVLTAGFPCQDVSHAGRRAGLIRGETRTGLWAEVVRAIENLQPPLVLLENVRGLLSAKADSDVEPCPWCMGDDGASPMRALGAVLADLADVGYDTAWCGLRAADVGAAHGRFRVFILAWPAADSERSGRGAARDAAPAEEAGRRASTVAGGADLLPTPDHLTLLPTPAVNDMGEGKTVEKWDDWTATMQAKHGNGNGHGKSLNIEAQRLLQTPSVADSEGGHERRGGARGDELLLNGQAKAWAEGKLLPTPRAEERGQRNSQDEGMALSALTPLLPTLRVKNNENRQSEGYGGEDGNFYGLLNNADRWGEYAPAIARWERVFEHPAPVPTMTSAKGNPQLSPVFTEWLMGLPEGHVTGVPGVTRNEALKACGNGVVPQQGAAALRWLLNIYAKECAA